MCRPSGGSVELCEACSVGQDGWLNSESNRMRVRLRGLTVLRSVKTFNAVSKSFCEHSLQQLAQWAVLHRSRLVAVNIATIRTRNAVTLFQIYAEAEVAKGTPPKGLEQGFAAKLGVGAATWSQAKSGRRPIGDKLARQIEAACDQPAGWLDQEREPRGLSQAEQAFLALALKAWRTTNAAGRRDLRDAMKKKAAG